MSTPTDWYTGSRLNVTGNLDQHDAYELIIQITQELRTAAQFNHDPRLPVVVQNTFHGGKSVIEVCIGRARCIIGSFNLDGEEPSDG